MSTDVYLGTANWGIKISKEQAFRMLDYFTAEGFSMIDTSTNYPINGIPTDKGLAILWLQEWIARNCGSKPRIFVKIGSVINSRDERFDLSPRKVTSTFEELSNRLQSSVYGIGIHWDNRDITMTNSISESIHALKSLAPGEIELGISGVRHPDAYKATGLITTDWIFQVKEHSEYSHAREEYMKYFPNNPYIAYGLSHLLARHGLLDKSLKTKLYLKGVEHIICSEKINGIIVGPSSLDQLKEVIDYIKSTC